MPTIRLRDEDQLITVPEGTNLWRALIEAGVAVAAPCGGRGTCGQCRVHISEGSVQTAADRPQHLSQAAHVAGWRLACTATVCEDVVVQVPIESRQEEIVAAYVDSWPLIETATDLRHCDVTLPAASLQDQRADQQRVRDALDQPELAISLGLLRELTTRLRSSEMHRLVWRDQELVAILPVGHDLLGAACDLGTTTIVVALIDCVTGERLAEASRPNPQTRFGADVVSRLGCALADPADAVALQRLVVDGIQELLGELCAQRGVAVSSLLRLVIAGNTAMQHLLLRLDVRGMAAAPFAPALLSGLRILASDLGFTLAVGAELLVMPGIAAYVGGDIVAGLLARRCDEAAPGPILFIDIGTNGELVLICDGQMQATATAAGPAFEGAGISCGMRARPGAIDRIALVDGELRLHTVADAEPQGLCGSGLLEAVALLVRVGVCDETGCLLDAEDWPSDLPAAIAERLDEDEAGPRFLLAGTGSEALALTQRDIRHLQLAKAAIAAGIEVLLSRAGLRAEQLVSCILAGGFGFHLDLGAAQRIGLLPAALQPAQVHTVGNSSLAGARLALLRADLWQRAATIAASCTSLELSGQADFEAAYVAAMEFPDAV